MNKKEFLRYWLPVILWIGFISWMSSGAFASPNTSRIIVPLLRFLIPSISEGDLSAIHGIIRKLAHVTEYFILGLLLFRGLKGNSKNVKSFRWSVYSLLVLIVLASADEFHQSFDATRTGSIIDVGIDTVGGLLGVGTILLWHRLRRT